MCLGQFYLEKSQKNALWNSFRDGLFAVEECTVKQLQRLPLCRRKENAAGYVLPFLFYKMSDQGSSWSYCAQRHTTTCVSRHNSKWLLNLSPQKIPWMRARLVWVPGYHSFFAKKKRISIYNTFPSVRSNHMVNVFITDQLRLFLPKHYVIRFSNLTSPWAPNLGHVTAWRWFLSKRT